MRFWQAGRFASAQGALLRIVLHRSLVRVDGRPAKGPVLMGVRRCSGCLTLTHLWNLCRPRFAGFPENNEMLHSVVSSRSRCFLAFFTVSCLGRTAGFRQSEIECLSRGELPAQFPLGLLHDCLELAFRDGEHGNPKRSSCTVPVLLPQKQSGESCRNNR